MKILNRSEQEQLSETVANTLVKALELESQSFKDIHSEEKKKLFRVCVTSVHQMLIKIYDFED
jgi:hypothetical protein